LIHVSEMSWSQHLRTAHDFMKVGDEVEAVILSLDREQRKMSLGIKQLIPDPWINIKEKYPINSRHIATVRNFTNFGIFVELEEGVDGLIHISDLSWSKKIKHPAEFTKIGEQIEVVVLDVDVESRRLSLGHKQLEENPWDVFETIFTPGSIFKGTIIEKVDKGYTVSLPYGVEAYLPSRQAVKENGEEAQLDETLDVKVTEFSKENKRIVVSHSKVYQDALAAEKAKEAKETEKLTKSPKKEKASLKKIKENIEKNTLGDIEALANLKEEMIEEEKAKLETLSKRKKSKKSKKSDVDETSELSPAQEILTEKSEQSSSQPQNETPINVEDVPSVEPPNNAINEVQSEEESIPNKETNVADQTIVNIDKEEVMNSSEEPTNEIPEKN
ncbi:MAG: S1 RNA-binding domain-containing protein, partial [Prolixibacteraceae bacterium]|nr:S1 RNA-binding domain-containing protein [Prolixibacteraceae bacterium]